MTKAKKGHKRHTSAGGGKARRSVRGKAIQWGGAGKRGDRRLNWAIAAGIVVLAAAGAGYWWQQGQIEQSFEALAAQGQPALERVESMPSQGTRHLAPGESHSYGERFPTSGPHDRTPTAPGFYEDPRPPTRLVHALEHGHVVVYYDAPGEAVLERLRDWASVYDGHWDGVVATKKPGLGETVVLTAWTKILRLTPFDPAAAAAFIDAYRGRGPERPVR